MKRPYKISLLCIGILLLAGIIITIIRWQAWFGNPTEEHYTTPVQQDRIVLSYTPTGRTISWRYAHATTKAEMQYVIAGTTDTLVATAQQATISTEGGTQTHYRATLPLDTRQAITCHYRLINDSVYSPWYSFQSNDTHQAMDFILFGDIQDHADGPSKQLFASVAERFPEIDFWAFVGDLAERPTDYYWNIVFDALQEHTTHIPIIASPGNHEHKKGIHKQLDERWNWMFGHPELQYPTDFSIDFPLMHIASINTDGLFWPWNYWQKKQQLEEANLLTAPMSQQWNIVLMHHPIYPGSIGRHNYIYRNTFKGMIEKNGVHLVMTGHDHNYARRTSEQGNKKSTPIYLLTTSSDKHYLSNCDPSADKIACGISLYSHIHCTKDSLVIKTYRTDTHELYDALSAIRTNNMIDIEDNGELMEEVILLPPYYKKESKTNIRKKFLKKREARASVK